MIGDTRWIALAVGAGLVVSAACGGSGTDEDRADRPTRSTTTSTPYAGRGPFEVGYTTLRMDDRLVDVWYPADAAVIEDEQKASYDQRTPLPNDLRSSVPDAYNAEMAMDAHPDVDASAEGPHPVVLFSHGAGAYRMASSALTVGLASWGLVVVSADYTERGVVTQLPGQAPATLDGPRDERTMLASLDLVADQSAAEGSVLTGAVDDTQVVAVGHSAGATAAFDALNDARVEAAIGWAPAPPSSTPPSGKPTMIVSGAADIAVTPDAVADEFEALPPPKRWVEIGATGHNSFTDLCAVSRDGGGMVRYAVDNHLVPDALAKLLLNGCEEAAVEPEEVWPVVQHFTVAHIRDALGIDARPRGLDARAARSFSGVTVQFEEQTG